MMMDLANVLASELRNALLTHDRGLLPCPVARRPVRFSTAYVAVDLDWDRVNVMLTDERWVPETSERSNTRLLRERLLVDKAAAATYVPLYADAPTPEEKLPELAAHIAPMLPINVMLLGMGADMHTASIFPEADQLIWR